MPGLTWCTYDECHRHRCGILSRDCLECKCDALDTVLRTIDYQLAPDALLEKQKVVYVLKSQKHQASYLDPAP